VFLTGTSKILGVLVLLTLGFALGPIVAASSYLYSHCSIINESQSTLLPISVGSNFPEVYFSKNDKLTVLKVEVPRQLIGKEKLLFLRRAATLIRHMSGNVIAYLTFDGSAFSETLNFFTFISQTKRGEPLETAMTKLIPRQQQFVLAKGCGEN
jgi:hypothetical protein